MLRYDKGVRLYWKNICHTHSLHRMQQAQRCSVESVERHCGKCRQSLTEVEIYSCGSVYAGSYRVKMKSLKQVTKGSEGHNTSQRM